MTDDVAPPDRPTRIPPGLPPRASTEGRRTPPDPYRDRIVVYGGSRDAVGLLHLAAVRSDDVLILTDASDEQVHAVAERLGAARCGLGRAAVEFGRAAAVLVAEGRPAGQEAVASSARSRSVPVFVAGRPDLSDFTLLDLLEHSACTRTRADEP